MWSHGHTFKDAVNKGDDPSTRKIFDAAAWLSGFHDANSDKEIKGDLTTTIDSRPHALTVVRGWDRRTARALSGPASRRRPRASARS